MLIVFGGITKSKLVSVRSYLMRGLNSCQCVVHLPEQVSCSRFGYIDARFCSGRSAALSFGVARVAEESAVCTINVLMPRNCLV